MPVEYRLDDLAREAGVPTTTIRLYRTRGLLAPPRMEGRTGWYGEAHLARLRLIARLQDQGFSLAGIGQLLDRWEQGRSLDALVGVEAGLDSLLTPPEGIDLESLELAARFPEGSMTGELMQRAIALGLVGPGADGTVHVTDRRFLEIGSALAHLGVPLEAVLDEWEALTAQTDAIAARFLDLFETHLAPEDWQHDLTADRAQDLAATLSELKVLSRDVLAAALDRSIAHLGTERLADLLPRSEPEDDR